MTDLEDLINIFKRKLCKDFKSLGIHLKENYISINKKRDFCSSDFRLSDDGLF